ncbi:MAG: hypothetical protein HGB03_02705 [Candidatus Yonathbacteria bacterium]|nr:hypothetical protein [Candidatus Yonathbacteria bacterium]NTW47448.1 hypothetical protein [Candidatus Yonathbacteria bacterium]
MAETGGPFINLEYVFYKVYTWIFGVPSGTGETGTLGGDGGAGTISMGDGGLVNTGNGVDIEMLVEILKNILGFITLLLIIGLGFIIVRIWELHKEMKKKPTFAEPEHVEKTKENERWEVVRMHVASSVPSDWRMAIIEADNILDDMVKRMGYEGKDLGERLRAVEPSDFLSIQSAWEAHKVRNKIAHEGLGFEISQREAKRVIDLYEQVFREFEYI